MASSYGGAIKKTLRKKVGPMPRPFRAFCPIRLRDQHKFPPEASRPTPAKIDSVRGLLSLSDALHGPRTRRQGQGHARAPVKTIINSFVYFLHAFGHVPCVSGDGLKNFYSCRLNCSPSLRGLGSGNRARFISPVAIWYMLPVCGSSRRDLLPSTPGAP